MTPPANQKPEASFFRLAVFCGGGGISVLLCYYSGNLGQQFGLLTLVSLTIFLTSLLLGLKEATSLLFQAAGRAVRLEFFDNIILIFTSFMLCLVMAEAILALQSALQPPPAPAPAKEKTPPPLALPDDWAMRPAEVPGAKRAYYWQGKLHVFDENGMRRHTHFPSKRDDTFRIMVVGDSLTYGMGVAAEETYPLVLERLLTPDYRLEVLNLGINGLQSEDIIRIIKEFGPRLRPDLIIYGFCLNDYLPSGWGKYQTNLAYSLPLPEWFKNFLIKGTRVGAFLDKKFDDFLRERGLRRTFMEEILANFPIYENRLASDLQAMESLASNMGAGPILFMVVDQWPAWGGDSQRIARRAEKLAAQAGMRVVATESYYRTYNGQIMTVSPWEGHPSIKAHQIFAEMLMPAVKQTPGLEAYRRE